MFQNYYFSKQDLNDSITYKILKKKNFEELDVYLSYIEAITRPEEQPEMFSKQRLNIFRNMIVFNKNLWKD